ncbi:MAG: hypothetical protein ACD_79C00570G0004 [uncultured bacterium]|nr:MAG: hypothetical protein ACD_79C00570G0004 [uncultured bacterium]
MKRNKFNVIFNRIIILSFIFSGLTNSIFAGYIFQDFEFSQMNKKSGKNLTSDFAVALNAKINLTKDIEGVKSNSQALKIESTEKWNYAEVQIKEEEKIYDDDNDRLVFSIYSLPLNKSNNYAGVKLFDKKKFSASGFEVWSDFTAIYSKWVRLEILFSQLPEDFDVNTISRIIFINYWPGTYYLDDILIVHESRIYQSFEPVKKNGILISDFGWIWNKGDELNFSKPDEPVFEGKNSLKIISKNIWGGAGIRSERKKYVKNSNPVNQSYWHVDLNPEYNDRLSFNIYPLPNKKQNINLAVQFYDNNLHSSDETKINVISREPAIYGKWNSICIPFASLPETLNLKNLNKIQFQMYEPGTYYLDKIEALGPVPELILKNKITLNWNQKNLSENPAFNIFQLEFRDNDETERWQLIYRGTKKTYNIQIKGLYRVRYERLSDFKTGVSYFSEWSNPIKIEQTEE